MSAQGHADHGHTAAGWTGTAIAVLGFAAAGLGVVTGWIPGIFIGLGVVAVAALVTWLLHLAGWGKPSGPRPASEWDWRVRDTGAHAGHTDCLGCRLGGPRRAAAAAPRPRSAVSLPAPDSTA
ncbi:HGxxPAAW family protein [Streptomyces sp. NPDC057011]|uniref:HGxxPAAW family protein n=1 Tax=unclassified Streptomyces TaxID=2593676 RepID=UPI003639084C